MESNDMPIPGWIPEKEMQTRSGLKTTTLWKLRTEGKLISSKIGKRTYYQLSSLLDLLEKNKI
jgi:hypothetical protein